MNACEIGPTLERKRIDLYFLGVVPLDSHEFLVPTPPPPPEALFLLHLNNKEFLGFATTRRGSAKSSEREKLVKNQVFWPGLAG